MSFQPFEVFMEWLDSLIIANAGIHSKTKNYTQKVLSDEELQVHAKTIIPEGSAVEIELTLLTKTDETLSSNQESYVQDQAITLPFTVEQLARQHSIEPSQIKQIQAHIKYEQKSYQTNTTKLVRTLKADLWKENDPLNDIVEIKSQKLFKKTSHPIEENEVKLIQKALKRMDIATTIDGKYGNDTKSAVEVFQSNYKPTHKTHTQYNWAENADGIVGRNTLLAMDEALVEGWEYQTCCGEEFKNKIQCTSYGSIYGPVYWGELKLADYAYWDDLIANGDVTEEEKDIIIAMSENEGKLDSVQSYDSEIITVGAMQKTVNPMGEGEFVTQVEEFKKSYPEKYSSLFEKCGWTVENKKMYYKDPNNASMAKVTGASLKKLIRKGYDKSNLKTYEIRCKPIEALIKATKDKDFQSKQVLDFVNRLTQKVLPIKPVGYSYTLNDYLKSKLGKATVLDQHINRPGYVAHDFASALKKFFEKNPNVNQNPKTWGTNHAIYEQNILNDYGLNRRGTAMSTRYNNLKKVL